MSFTLSLKFVVKYFLLFLTLVISLLNSHTDQHFQNNINNLNNTKINSFHIKYNLVEDSEFGVKIDFPPGTQAERDFISEISYAKKNISCAFFELNDKKLIERLKEFALIGGKIRIIVDDRYENEPILKYLSKLSNVKIISDKNRKSRYNNYQHNKFCVLDNRFVITGSTNPTQNGFLKNNNNFIFIDSKLLAKNYLNEFNQMFNFQYFGNSKNNVLEYNNITLRFNNETYLLSSYFCPENNCEKEVIKILNTAKHNISFATFALTNDHITETIIKLVKENISVRGVIERRNINLRGSDYERLKSKINFHLDCNRYNMHNKYFIIDDQYLITGSMNPTGNGVKYNDENILIIKSKKIAEKFLSNFNKLFICNIDRTQI